MNEKSSGQGNRLPANTENRPYSAGDTAIRRSTATTIPGNRRRGPSKEALGRAKLGAAAVTVVAFVGSLFGVIKATPNYVTPATAGSQAQAQQLPASVAQAPARGAASPQLAPLPQAPAPLVMPQAPQRPTIRPLVRSRGS